MKNCLLVLGAFFSVISALRAADVPDVVITTLMSANGHGTIAGHLTAKPQVPVGISVRNGNLTYSTLTDGEGRWGIVIRHQSTQVTANSWSLTNPEDRGREVSSTIDSPLPWTKSVSGSGSAGSETSAKYQADNSLRSQINTARSQCSSDKGSFSYSGGFIYCNKAGLSYRYSGTARCTCR